jgi:hypothetical protein
MQYTKKTGIDSKIVASKLFHKKSLQKTIAIYKKEPM